MYRNKRLLLWICYLCVFIMCIPNNPKFPTIVKYAIDALLLLSYMFSVGLFFIHKYYRRIALYWLYLWLFWVIVATILNGTDVLGAVKLIAPLFCSSICTMYLCDYDIHNVYRIISWMFTILLVIQLYTMINHVYGTVYTQGKYVYYYFFGIRVAINKIAPFAAFFGLISAGFGNKKSPISLIISTFCGLYFAIGEKVSTCIVCYTVIALTLMVSKFIRSEHFWRNIGILFLLLSSLFVILYAGDELLFRWLLEDILNESITLSGRTSIWNQAFSYMKGIHWLIGNGYGHNYYFYLGKHWVAQVTHNQYLETVFKYGIIGLIIYIMMCMTQLRVNTGKKNDFISRVFFSTFIAMIIIQIPATVFEKVYYYIFYVASLYLPIVSEYAKNDRRRTIRIRLFKPKRVIQK